MMDVSIYDPSAERLITARLDFGAAAQLLNPDVGTFTERSRKLMELYSSAKFIQALALEGRRTARKEALDECDLEGLDAIGKRDQRIKQHPKYVMASNVIDTMSRYLDALEWSLRIMQTAAANERVEFNTN